MNAIRFSLVALLAVLLVFSACDGGDDDGGAPPGPSATPEASPTSAASPGAGRTGIEAVDRVLAVVENGDPVAFEALLRARSIPCSTAAGVGGPPPCSGAPGMPPEGTPVEAFPYDTCEREWQFDLGAFTERILERIDQLYAVVRIESMPLPEELADGAYGLIYPDASGFETAHALLVTNDGVVAVDSSCGGTAEIFLQDGPPFDGPEVILEGPAFE